MSAPARTVAIFSGYMFITGLCFVLIPNIVLPLFGFSATTEVWIRVAGLLVIIIGSYYLYCALYEALPFIQATVFGRIVFCIGLVVLALLRFGSFMLILFGLVDLAGAVWTWLSLRAICPGTAPVGIK